MTICLSTTITIPTILLLLLLTTLPTKINSQAPTSKTFSFTLNKPQLVSNKAEYGATYVDVLRATGSTEPVPPSFALCFYNTTPNAYVLSVRTTGSPARFVWAANRNRPVGEGSTLSLGRDGDLTLTRPDGRVAWRSGTAGKGVEGIELTPEGDLVLRDGSGRGAVWRSFDRPADTLLVGMSLGVAGGPGRIVSRKSEADGSDGPYSLVMEEQGLVAYWNYDGKDKRVRYADWLGVTSGNKATLSVDSSNSSSYDLIFQIESSEGRRNYVIKTFPYDPTRSFLRIASDGNILIFTYNPKSAEWQQTFSYFPDYHNRECALPSRCGRFGLCDSGRCVGCPSPTKGLTPWSGECEPPSLGRRCGGTRGKVGYYRVDGAEHFLTLLTSGEGPMSASECGRRCTSEGCECKGFVFDGETGICLRVPVLGTLIREGNSTLTSVYVKYSE